MHTMHPNARRAFPRLALFGAAALGCGALALTPARAQTTYNATLSGLQETTQNASFGFGTGLVILNAARTSITVDLSWTGLSSGATAGHIHSPGALGVNAPVLFPFAGVPNTTSGAIPEQTFAITPAQVTQLQAGLMYFNIHTALFPGGEIRGQIAPAPVPEASTTASLGLLLALGMGGLVVAGKRKKAGARR